MRTPPICSRHLLLVSLSLSACFTDPLPVDSAEATSDEPSDDSTEASASATSTGGSDPTADPTVDPTVDPSVGPTATASTDPTDPDGTTSDTDDPSGSESTTGEPAPRVVFVTEGAFFANLGGVAGADARCAAEASAAGLSGDFLAWISDDTLSPDARFTREGGPWVRVDGAVVAVDWSDLVDGILDDSIDLDADGQPLDDQLAVWTNTDWNGTGLAADCQGWTSMAFGDSGIFGDFASGAEFGQWTAWGNPTPFPCENTFHLYCFEQ